MDYNIQTCTDCFPNSFHWHHNGFDELKSETHPWLFSYSNPEEQKLNEISFPWFLKDYSVNMDMEPSDYMYRSNNWNNVNNDWNYGERSKLDGENNFSVDQHRDCFSSCSDNLMVTQCSHKGFVADSHLLNKKSENLLILLRDSEKCCDISSIVEIKDESQPIPEQHLTFASPESAFYDYQQKMESQLCQVCRESAAGFHHGAYVCEACKKFFMRHNMNCTKFTIPCPTGGQCVQLKAGRIKCQSCRFKKCIGIGMALQNLNNENSKFDISKIPCRVCGGKSSGFHFGALTCEGCKGFFRRTESSSHHLVCVTGYDECSLTGSTSRNLCKSCRFRKCIGVGMSKKGSRIGRQPNAVKFHCVLEIMKRSQDQNISNDDPANDCTDQKSDFHRTFRKMYSPSRTTLTRKIQNDFDNLKEEILAFPEHSNFYSDQEKYFFENSIKDASRIIEISKANLRDMSNRHFSEKSCILNDLWNYMMNNFDVHSAMTVQFVKAIPGFNKFELKSRRALVQEAMYPIMLLKLAQDYKAETDEYNYFDFSVSDREIILKNFHSFHKITDHLLTVSRIVYSLNLSSYPISLMCVMELMKNCSFLSNPDEGERILNQAKTLLWSYLENDEIDLGNKYYENESNVLANHSSDIPLPNGYHRFHIIFKELPKLMWEMNLEHLKIIQELKSDHPELIFPELYMDMFNIQDPKTLVLIDDHQ